MNKILSFYPFILLSFISFSLSAQTISNVNLVYSCPCKVTVTYDLNTTKPTDVQLFYSPDTVGYSAPGTTVGNWLLAETFPAKLTGTNTDIWDCDAAGVLYGQFYFKVEAVQEEVCECGWVFINGVKWATCNVDAPGIFTACPKDAGMFYQWNRPIGWSSTDPMINSNDGTTWNSSTPPGTAWVAANDPSPSGYRVPTYAEFQTLLNTTLVTNVLTTENGVNGRRFTDITTGNSIFLPAANYRGNSYGTLNYFSGGYYWSSTQYNTGIAFSLYNSNIVFIFFKTNGFSVRPVAE